jgi:superfamily II DNA or RNA helicase
MMALKLDTVRLLIADDVGIGKTIEAGLIARELLDRGEISRIAVICPPHLCDQWQRELSTKFNLQAEIVRTGTASRLERGLPAGKSIFDVYPFTVVSLDYIKSDRRLDDFSARCPEFVIVEEAHTCVQGSGDNKHQRFKLLRRLAEDSERHLVFLTATPHSGDEDAFYNLLGLLNPKFHDLREALGEDRDQLREQLALHFVQRRRPDIAEWKDDTVFPDRHTKEIAYKLTGEWGVLFDAVLSYARQMVKRAEGQKLLQQRMSWWAALALLRCISSSPAAAANALRTRLKAVEGLSEDQQVKELEERSADSVLDGFSEDLLSVEEVEPAGIVEDATREEDIFELTSLIEKSESLRGQSKDPKLACLIDELNRTVKEGFSPVVFCRYIATAHYVGEELQKIFGKSGYIVTVITGELTSEEREEKVYSLVENEKRILVATDCLSEGVNLQDVFDAVVHYDLSWNPTRHEQREGRVDRFLQASPIVRAIMLFGENNPVDGAVLQVILRKAERIRKELGVSVPMPEDSNKVMQAVMESVLLKSGSVSAPGQLKLDLGLVDNRIEEAWLSAKEKAKQSQTLFAQRRIKPDEVLPEWQKAVEVLGGEGDVQRFVSGAAQRLGASLEESKGIYKFPVSHLNLQLQERLEAQGIKTSKPLRLVFSNRAASRATHVHRTHPLVATLAEHIAERALAEDTPDLAARSTAIFTKQVHLKTTIYLLRLRSQIMVRRKDKDSILLSEECVSISVTGADKSVQLLSESEVRKIMSAEVTRNMDYALRIKHIQTSIEKALELEDELNEIAKTRANELLLDHRRVREASEGKGVRYSVEPCLPADIIGIYVLIPDKDL